MPSSAVRFTLLCFGIDQLFMHSSLQLSGEAEVGYRADQKGIKKAGSGHSGG
jgi:hypothetical protein